jgi:methenyltetrahydromethanopterin cyclohydrolase
MKQNALVAIRLRVELHPNFLASLEMCARTAESDMDRLLEIALSGKPLHKASRISPCRPVSGGRGGILGKWGDDFIFCQPSPFFSVQRAIRAA